MAPIAEIIDKLYLGAVGLGVMVGVLYVIYYRDAHFWRHLAQQYARPWTTPLQKKRFQHAVAYGDGFGSKSYNGLLTIGLHETGVALRVTPPFSYFHEPIFIPYKDIRGWDQSWYLNASTLELEFERAPKVKLVMPAEQVQWIQSESQNAMEISTSSSPHNDKPTLWYFILLFQLIAGILLVLYLISLGYISF
ncbi:MAG: hypothetical protein AAGC77_01535 [Pseudomonadota bacterium]